MSLDSTIHADATVAPFFALPSNFALQSRSVDQSDREVSVNLRQSGPTPVEMLISTRVRKPPFWHLSHAAGCWRATVYNRTYYPRGYPPPTSRTTGRARLDAKNETPASKPIHATASAKAAKRESG